MMFPSAKQNYYVYSNWKGGQEKCISIISQDTRGERRAHVKRTTRGWSSYLGGVARILLNASSRAQSTPTLSSRSAHKDTLRGTGKALCSKPTAPRLLDQSSECT